MTEATDNSEHGNGQDSSRHDGRDSSRHDGRDSSRHDARDSSRTDPGDISRSYDKEISRTATEDIAGDADEERPGILARISGFLTDLRRGLLLNTLLVVTLGIVAVSIGAKFIDASQASLMTKEYDLVTERMAKDLDGKTPTQSRIMEMIENYHLAWFYISDASGQILPVTRPYAPDLKEKPKLSPHIVSVKGRQFYQAVAQLGSQTYLHAGFGTDDLQPLEPGGLVLPLRTGQAYVLMGSVVAFVLLFLRFSVSRPLNHLSKACTSLLLSRDAYSGVTSGGLNVPWYAVTEVDKIARGLKDVRRQYDAQALARIAKEDELKKTKSEHSRQQKDLVEKFEEKLADREQSLSELSAKESEEEFISSLNRVVETSRSRHQVCQKILDRLNDKFPTSIIYAAFFTLSESSKPELDSFIGFDDLALKTLKSINHTSLCHQLHMSGKYETLGLDGLRERGLQDLSQQLDLKSAVYFPLTFHNKMLGLFAVYFNIQGSSVQDRIRVLRRVSEIASRQIYQIAIYIEELEAARTDPLTGLRNKKYFNEVVGQVIERSRVSNLPCTFILVDGDHFKQVNDTFGHQVGDEVLKQLAESLRKSVRLNTDGMRPGDCLVRFGGEEFLVILEQTDRDLAKTIAERIRKAVEEKLNWPGGVPRMTVSVGTATYPMDGSTLEEVLLKADTALYYVKKELNRNNVSQAHDVPKTFKWAKSSPRLAGELGVFEPSTLLQAFGNSLKSGVLTVDAPVGRLWVLFEKGKLLQARLGSCSGADAIVEFLATFDEGAFNFQEQGPGGLQSLPKLDSAFDVKMSMDRCLIESALAKDNYEAARSVIFSDSLCLVPIDAEEFDARWRILKDIPDPPTPDEMDLMNTIASRLDGTTSLASLFITMDKIPTVYIWRAAALLVQHGLAHPAVEVEKVMTAS